MPGAHHRVHTTVERFGDVLATCRIDMCDAPDLQVRLRHNRRTVTSTVTRELAAKRVDARHRTGHYRAHGRIPAPARSDLPPDPSEARQAGGDRQRPQR